MAVEFVNVKLLGAPKRRVPMLALVMSMKDALLAKPDVCVLAVCTAWVSPPSSAQSVLIEMPALKPAPKSSRTLIPTVVVPALEAHDFASAESAVLLDVKNPRSM